ncbi:MAG: hypothetical protein O2912_08945, partial [Proteobacteria bacterium]|nr:hypothetical protein [Pseudomonadota bacterium]
IKAGINPAADDVGRCAAIRAAAGKGARLSADANQGFSFLDAISFAEAAAGAGLDFIEQPIDAHNINGMADIVAAAGPVGVCADEGIHNLSDIEAHHMAKAATGCGLKGIKLGGLTRMLEAAELCNDYGLHVNIAGKIAETSIASAAIVHLAHAIPQIDWDISVTCQYVAKDVVKNPVTTVDGHVSVDDAPGLGLEIDEDEIGRVTVIR